MPKLNNFSKQYRIYYEDTDAGGVVYYANYLKFFERARTDFLRSKNINQNELIKKENIAFVVKKCLIDYVKPAQLDDLIEVSVKIIDIKPASIKIYQEIIIDDVILSKLDVEIVCVNVKNFRPKKLNDDLKKIFI